MSLRMLQSESAAIVASGLAGVAAIVASLGFRHQIAFVPEFTARSLGLAMVAVGMALFLWAASKLGGGAMGGIEPRGKSLVVDGPFAMVRHPVYLGMAIAMSGVWVSTRSLVGAAATLLLFIPAEVHRARLEERALLRRFGAAWREYAATTGFFIPRVLR